MTKLQPWCADMWCVLWTLWSRGDQTRTHPEMDFSWATHARAAFHKCPVLHMAGVTKDVNGNLFRKYRYVRTDPLVLCTKNPNHFFAPASADTVDKEQISYEYALEVADCARREWMRL